MGLPLPGVELRVEDGELVLADPGDRPHLLRRLPRRRARARDDQPWHTGDRVAQDEDGYLYFEGRTDDVIISAGYRIGPFEVESALVSHPAVAEAAVVAAPDEERGRGRARGRRAARRVRAERRRSKTELQDHVKRETAPYKYPRIVEFAAELPKTASGKVKRAQLRSQDVRRPAIGICAALEHARWGVWERRAVLLAHDYIVAIQDAGGLPLMIPPDPHSSAIPTRCSTGSTG